MVSVCLNTLCGNNIDLNIANWVNVQKCEIPMHEKNVFLLITVFDDVKSDLYNIKVEVISKLWD